MIKVSLLLQGKLEGKTHKFRQYHFVDGKIDLVGEPEEVAQMRRYLEVNLNVVPADGPAVTVESETQKDNQVPSDLTEPDARLQAALDKLDHRDDAHWTQSGKPALAAVEKFYGSTDITRADIDALAPDLHRCPPEEREA